jgi:hypothetical protein
VVEYSMDISILKPIDMSKGNRTLLYETVNRGRKNLPFLNIGGDLTKPGDGFLQRQGYTLAWSGWQGDITTGVRIALPVAVNPAGSQITGRVRAEYILTAPVATVNITAPPAYEAASLDNAGATLTRRVHQGDARETISNSRWAFADCSSTPFPGKPNAVKVCLDGSFDTNHIYELVYTAKNPTVAGIGFAATREHCGPGSAWHLYRVERAQERFQRRRFLRPARSLHSVLPHKSRAPGRWRPKALVGGALSHARILRREG